MKSLVQVVPRKLLQSLRWVGVSSFIAMGASASASALAQEYPTRPVKIVVPYAPGGPVDQLARGLADRLTQAYAKPFIIENKPGGNTIVAATTVAKARADGHTLLLASSASLAVNPLVYKSLAYDPERDFLPISMLATAPLVMVVGADVPARNLKELVPHIKGQGGNFAYASNGNGNPLHLACALFASMANVEMLHVPYNGTAPALASLLTGETKMACDIVLSSLPQIKAGKVKPIGIVGPKRVAVLPNVPTLAEEGLLGVDATVWFALVAPKGTSPAIVSQLNASVAKALEDSQMKARFRDMAMELESSEPQDVWSLTARERAKWSEVVKKFKIELD